MYKLKYLSVILLLFASLAIAGGGGGGGDPNIDIDVDQQQGQITDVNVGVNNTVGVSAGASAQNEGNELSVNSTYESGPADLVLVPNNNTETCLRVFGFAFGNDSASGILGVPYRSKKCDFEQAADDAFAAGERTLGWFWKCQNSNLYKQFKGKRDSAEVAKETCLAKMTSEIDKDKIIAQLQAKVDTLSTERAHDLEEFRQTREKLATDCAESRNRILATCQDEKSNQ